MCKTHLLPAIAVLLSGCAAQTAPVVVAEKPISEMNFKERCGKLLELSGNPYLNGGERSAAYETARNTGCMGPPQPQTVIVR